MQLYDRVNPAAITMILSNPTIKSIEPILHLVASLEGPTHLLSDCLSELATAFVHLPGRGGHLLEVLERRSDLKLIVEKEVLSLEIDTDKLSFALKGSYTPLGFPCYHTEHQQVAPETEMKPLPLYVYTEKREGVDLDRRVWPEPLRRRPGSMSFKELTAEYLPDWSLPVPVVLLDLFPSSSKVLQIAFTHVLINQNMPLIHLYLERGVTVPYVPRLVPGERFLASRAELCLMVASTHCEH